MRIKYLIIAIGEMRGLNDLEILDLFVDFYNIAK